MKKTDSTEKLRGLIKEGTSPFHVAAAIVKELQVAGFEPLEKLPEILASRELRAKGKYVILPNGEEGKGTNITM